MFVKVVEGDIMKALVMGGSEFVGAGVTRHLIDKGYEVDIFTRGIRAIDYSGVHKHLVGDRRDVNRLSELVRDESYDFVFDISAYTKDDVEKLVLVLNKEKLKRYVFCSSGAVYKDSDEVIREDFPCGFNENWGKYGFDKCEAEFYLQEQFYRHGLPITIFRPSYIYGEGNNLYREGYFFEWIGKGSAIPVPYGNVSTQFVHIEDLVMVFESSLHIEKSIGEAYNVTYPTPVTWIYLLEVLMKVVGKVVATKIIKNSDIAARKYFPFRNVTYLLSQEKLKNDGLYIPKIELYEGLSRAYKWYNENDIVLKDVGMSKIDYVLNNEG